MTADAVCEGGAGIREYRIRSKPRSNFEHDTLKIGLQYVLYSYRETDGLIVPDDDITVDENRVGVVAYRVTHRSGIVPLCVI